MREHRPRTRAEARRAGGSAAETNGRKPAAPVCARSPSPARSPVRSSPGGRSPGSRGASPSRHGLAGVSSLQRPASGRIAKGGGEAFNTRLDRVQLYSDEELQDRNLCGCMRTHPWRRVAQRIVDAPAFQSAILALILANTAVMALETEPYIDLPSLELLFTVAFTVELLLKVVALRPLAYASDGWNLLDLFVVVTAWIPYILPAAGNYSVLRAVRILRALRTIGRVPSLKRIVSALIGSLPQLRNVAGLAGLFLLLFGIVGLTYFNGKLHYRCAESPYDTPIDDAAVCALGPDESPDGRGTCDDDQRCVYFEANPADGTVSYDNIGGAMVSLFQARPCHMWGQRRAVHIIDCSSYILAPPRPARPSRSRAGSTRCTCCPSAPVRRPRCSFTSSSSSWDHSSSSTSSSR